MHCMSSPFAITFLVLSSVTTIWSVRVAVPEQWRKKRFDAEQDVTERLTKRDVCYNDDYEQGLAADPGYFSAVCSSLLTATNAISTSDTTTTTTISTVYTTFGPTESTTATLPSTTVTTTAPAILRKRQTALASGAVPSTILIGATAPQAISSMLSDCQASPTGEKLSILNSYSSACSCFISPGVNTVVVTLISTRTISGQDRTEYIDANTVTSGVTTVTANVIPPPSNGLTTHTNATVLSGSPTVSTNSTIASSSSTAPTPSLSSCPAANGTTYVTQGQTFEVLCDYNFDGSIDQGLSVPSLHQCIDDCAITNIGFSIPECYAATWNPNQVPGSSNCFFKTLNNSLAPFPDDTVISALLITPLTPINGTNTTLPSGTGVFPSGTGILRSGSIYPTGSSLLRPIISINVTTTPSFSVSLTISDNRTFVGPTGTGFTPSGTGIRPSGSGVLPIGSGVFPSDTGVPRTGILPTGTGIIPSGTGIFPSGSGSANSTWCGSVSTVTVTVAQTTIFSEAPHSTDVIVVTETLSY